MQRQQPPLAVLLGRTRVRCALRLQVNMLAREYCDDIKRKNKPIILSHRCATAACLQCWQNRILPQCLAARAEAGPAGSGPPNGCWRHPPRAA